MRGATLCSGIGAPETALPHWDWLWCAEVEPFPSRVLAARHPGSTNLGDITADDFVERAVAIGVPDVLVAGTPCQSFSVAGLRGGLHDDRGRLTVRFIEIVAAIRPQFVVWENVPGVMSLDDGKVFQYILESLNDIGYAVEADVLDAQHHGVPQRRRRIFLICHHIEAGRKQRSDLFAATALSWLIEILVGTSAALLMPSRKCGRGFGLQDQEPETSPASARKRKKTLLFSGTPRTTMTSGLDAALGVLRSPYRSDALNSEFSASLVVDGLKRKMKLLGLPSETPADALTWTDAWGSLLSDLDEALAKYRPTLGNSVYHSEQPRDGRLNIEGVPAVCSMASAFLSIATSWKDIWDAACAGASTSIMSTSTSGITNRPIYICAEALLNTGSCMLGLSGLPESSYVAASSALTATEAYISYARSLNECLFGSLPSGDDWSSFERRATLVRSEIERRLRGWRDSEEVLPVAARGCGNPAPSRQARKDVARTLTGGSGKRGWSGDNGTGQGCELITSTGAVSHCLNAGGMGRQDFEKDVAPCLSARTKGGGGLGTDFECEGGLITAFGGNNTAGEIDVATALNAHGGPHGRCDFESETFVTHSLRGEGFDASEDGTGRGVPLVAMNLRGRGNPAPCREAGKGVAPTLSARTKGGGELGTDFDCDGGLVAAAFLHCNKGRPAGRASAHTEMVTLEDVVPTLATDGHTQSAVAYRTNAASQLDCQGDKAATLTGMSDPCARFLAFGGNNTSGPIDVATACNAHGGSGRMDFETETFIASALRGEGFDASEDGTGRRTQIVPVLAFAENSRAELRLEGGDGSTTSALKAGGGKPGQSYPAIQYGMDVRRLTPRECERLQGFPEQEISATIFVCSSEKQKIDAIAEIQSPKSRLSALGAAESESRLSVDAAGRASSIHLLDQEWPVAIYARIDFDRMGVEIRSHERLLWSADNADEASWSLPMLLPGSFARAFAPMLHGSVPTTTAGRAASPPSIRHSTPLLHGNVSVALCGREIAALAADAERFTKAAEIFTKSITSEVGPNSLSYGQTWETWSCFVAAAISGFIPERTRNAGSYALSIEAVSGYTLVPYRNGLAADGPRYKALGNSMAVPCIAWIGRRIEEVARAVSQREAA